MRQICSDGQATFITMRHTNFIMGANKDNNKMPINMNKTKKK